MPWSSVHLYIPAATAGSAPKPSHAAKHAAALHVNACLSIICIAPALAQFRCYSKELSRWRAVLLPVCHDSHPVARELRLTPQHCQEVVERRNRHHRYRELLLQFLYRRPLSSPAFHAVECDQHCRRRCALRSDKLDRFALRPAVGDDVVDDQDPPHKRRSDNDPAFAVILGLFAVVAVRQIVPFFSQCDSRRRGQRYALVRGAEQLIALHARRQIRPGIKIAKPAQAFAVVEQACVEKIGSLPSRLGHELAKSKHVACQCKFEKILAEIGHEAAWLKAVERLKYTAPDVRDARLSRWAPTARKARAIR